MPEITDILLQRIQAIMPDLTILKLVVYQEGLINQVAIVNQSYVFRFARTAWFIPCLTGSL
jgi:hypothetical protein